MLLLTNRRTRTGGLVIRGLIQGTAAALPVFSIAGLVWLDSTGTN